MSREKSGHTSRLSGDPQTDRDSSPAVKGTERESLHSAAPNENPVLFSPSYRGKEDTNTETDPSVTVVP